MMRGLIGPDLRREDCGRVHRTTTGARLVLWNPADGILPKNLAYPTHGRVRTVYHIYRTPPSRKTHGIANICLRQREFHIDPPGRGQVVRRVDNSKSRWAMQHQALSQQQHQPV